jgi:PIN domain nuclease of toxin-antitoxin system
LEEAIEVRLLLDTNALLWTLLERQRLSSTAIDAIENQANDVFISVVSAWEIEIKRSKGKLHVPHELEAALAAQRFDSLPVTMRHAHAVESLPRIHRDPFDRMIIAQAHLDGITIVSSDGDMRHYPVAVLPAV